MPEIIQCPNCNRKLRVPDNLIGKKVKCPSCSKAFTAAAVEEDLPTAPLLEEETAKPSPRRPPPPPAEEEIQEKPPRPRRVPARPVEEEDEEEAADDEYDDDEEVQPRRRKRSPADEYEEEEEDEEIRPRRRRRRRGSRARTAVAAPAIALMVTGSLSLALYLIQLILILAGVDLFGWQGQNVPVPPQQAQAFNAGRIVGGVVGTILAMCWAGIVTSAGFKMKNLQGHGYAMTGSIVAMLPCNVCCLLGLPFGIWSLVVLNKPEVKDAFR